jgi:hypothetical protein
MAISTGQREKNGAFRKYSSLAENGDSQDSTTAVNACATLRRQKARAYAIDTISQTHVNAAPQRRNR